MPIVLQLFLSSTFVHQSHIRSFEQFTCSPGIWQCTSSPVSWIAIFRLFLMCIKGTLISLNIERGKLEWPKDSVMDSAKSTGSWGLKTELKQKLGPHNLQMY